MKRTFLKLILSGILCACSFLIEAEAATTQLVDLKSTKILEKYCFDCHSDGVDKGGIDFDILLKQKENHEQWSKVWEVIDKAHKLAIVCKSHCVPMPAAALRFPLAHPAVKSVIPGCRNPQEFKQLMEWWNTKIPTELWSDLKSQGLIDQIAPVPGA